MPPHVRPEDVMVTKSDNSSSSNQPYQLRKEFHLFRDFPFPRTEGIVMPPDYKHDYVSEPGCVSAVTKNQSPGLQSSSM
jgi:hypothetical protein